MTEGKLDDLYVEIAFPLPLHQTFTYSAGGELKARLAPGVRVRAPFGRRRLTGYCVAVRDEAPPFATRPICEVLDDEPFLSPDLIELARWMSAYYLAPLGEVFEAMLPRGVRQNVAAETIREARLAVSVEEARQAVEQLRKRAGKQALVLEALIEANRTLPVSELAEVAGASPSAVTTLARKGLVELCEVRPSDAFLASAQEPLAIPQRLTGHQEKALAEIGPCVREERFSVFLLHGITGSGKTEVYLRAAQEAVALGRGVLYLVPEIALTPQTVRRLSSRFEDVAVFHSALSDGERNEAWRRVRAGRSRVVLGTRSAVFAPVAGLGLVVIDEEHEPTFKQETSPRYHARSVAMERARRGGAVVVLGSASPSLETYAAARSGEYRMLTLPERIERRPLPPVQVVDLRYDKGHMRYGRNLSRELAHYVEEALSLGEQVLLFMNRRGFAATVHCPRCGHTFFCSNCAVALTYHRKGSCLLCHYCLARTDLPRECPECLSANLSFRGRGTERIEHEISEQFPKARVLRMDSDAASTRDFYPLAFEDFRNRRIDILVGTQVLAKGLDFPNVTLVGVILADVALSLPDFRASERAFQLLSQVAGRAGRGSKGGRVVIQTYNPESLPIQAARTHDYERFAERELEDRKLHGYPPSARLVQAVASAANESAAAKACGALADGLRRALAGETGIKVLGPAPAPLPRLAGRYRYHVLVKAPLELDVSSLLAPVVTKFKAGSAAITVDVDPQSVL